MIDFTTGNIFDVPADVRINTVNCVGVMGAGVALAFKIKYPEMFREYKRECKKGTVRPGSLHVWRSLYSEYIVNLPTKRHWREPSRYEDVEAGLVALRKFLKELGKVRVALPALGCGHGGLEWERVSQMIRHHLSGLEADIIVFNPSASQKAGQLAKNGDDHTIVGRLNSQGVVTLGPDDERYPRRLRCKNARHLYVRGNLQRLDQPLLGVLPSVRPLDREIKAAMACVEAIVEPDITIMVGYSAKLERPIIRRALEKGAQIVLWLAEGILNFAVQRDLEGVWDPDRVTVVSAAKPTQPWTPSSASHIRTYQMAFCKALLITDPSPGWVGRMLESGPKYFLY